MSDNINRPAHYLKYPVEVIEITECLNFNMGNVVKYVLRADYKGHPIEDLEKSRWYITREIERRKRLAADQPQRDDDDLRAAIQRLEAGNQKEDPTDA